MVKSLQGRATWLVHRAGLRAHSLIRDTFNAAGTRGYYYRILAALEELGPASQADLVRVTGLDRSDVSVSLDALRVAGFARREPHPSDRRRNLVSMTERGCAELTRLDAVLDSAQERFLAPLSTTEQADFLALIARLGGERP